MCIKDETDFKLQVSLVTEPENIEEFRKFMSFALEGKAGEDGEIAQRQDFIQEFFRYKETEKQIYYIPHG